MTRRSIASAFPSRTGTQESLVEYSRRQGIKETLLERVVATCVETGEAARYLLVATGRDPAGAGLEPWEVPAERVLQAAQEEDVDAVRAVWPALLDFLRRQPLLYVPTARGGNPLRVAASRNLVRMLGRLLDCVPRLGLLTETYRLLAADPGNGAKPSGRPRGRDRVRPPLRDRLQGRSCSAWSARPRAGRGPEDARRTAARPATPS